MNEPDVPEIVGHLVDEIRPFRPVEPGVGQIFSAERQAVLRGQQFQRAGIENRCPLPVGALHPQHDALDVGQFVGALHLGMGGQDLFQQGRSGAGEADDEDRIGPGIAPPLAVLEEGGRADPDLPGGIGLHGFGPVGAVLQFQAVATLVTGPGLRKFPPVLQRLAQGKAQVPAVLRRDAGRGFLGAHAAQLLVGEPVHLEIGEAPVGITEVRAGRCGRAIGVDGFRHLPDGLQGMTQPQMHPRRIRVLRQHLAIDADRRLVVPDAHLEGGGQDLVVDISGVECQQSLHLRSGQHELLPLDQGLGVFIARQPVVGLQTQHAGQQGLRIVEHVVGEADPRQQAHGLGMVPVLEQPGTDDPFCGLEIPVVEQGRGGDDLRGQRGQHGHMLRRQGRVVGIPGHPVEAVQHLPAGRQGRIEMNGLQKGLDRPVRIAPGDEAHAALLVQAAVLRAGLLKPGQGLERRFDISHVPLADGGEQQEVAVVAPAPLQRRSAGQHLDVATLPLEPAQPVEVPGVWGQVSHEGGTWGGRTKKSGGHLCPPIALISGQVTPIRSSRTPSRR